MIDQNKKIIYLDMDGVIANFIKGASRVHADEDLHPVWRDHMVARGIPIEEGYDICKLLGITTSFFWERIDLRGHSFWEELEMYPWTGRLMAMLENYGDIVLLTSPSMSPECVKGKTLWIQNHLGKTFRDYIICPAPLKKALANSNSILIDDSPKNCLDFDNAGGSSVLFPQPWNQALDQYYELASDGIIDNETDYIKHRMEKY